MNIDFRPIFYEIFTELFVMIRGKISTVLTRLVDPFLVFRGTRHKLDNFF